MRDVPLFTFQVIDHNDNDIEILGFIHVDGTHYRQMNIFLNRLTIEQLIKAVGKKGRINNRTIYEKIKNGYDDLEIKIEGSETRPVLIIWNKGHTMGNGELQGGIIDIPLDPIGRNKEDMKYINRLVSKLREYI